MGRLMRLRNAYAVCEVGMRDCLKSGHVLLPSLLIHACSFAFGWPSKSPAAVECECQKCMYVCVCVCVYVCMYVCMYVCILLQNAVLINGAHKCGQPHKPSTGAFRHRLTLSVELMEKRERPFALSVQG